MNIAKTLPATIGADLYRRLTNMASTELALLVIWTLSGLLLCVITHTPMDYLPG